MSPVAAQSPQSVQRVLGILELLAQSESGQTLSAIARHLDAPKNSVISLIAGLLASGYLARDERALYRLGPAAFALSTRIAGGMKLPGLVRPTLVRLMEGTGETALAGTLAPDADEVIYVEKAESRNPMRYTVPVGERRELYCTAIGKLALAFMAPDAQAECLRRLALVPHTTTTVTSLRQLKVELARIRNTGTASSQDQRILGASGLAAAVVDRDGRFIAGLGIVGPTGRIKPNAARHTELLVKEARALSELVAGAGAGAAFSSRQ